MQTILIWFSAILTVGIVLFLSALAVIEIYEKRIIKNRNKKRGVSKKIKRKIRKEIFRRLRAKRKNV